MSQPEDNIIRLGDICFVLPIPIQDSGAIHWTQEYRDRYTNTECEVIEVNPTKFRWAYGELPIKADFKVKLHDGKIAYFARKYLRKKRGWDPDELVRKEQPINCALDVVREDTEKLCKA